MMTPLETSPGHAGGAESKAFNPAALGQRRRREYHTSLAMIEIYCQAQHGRGEGRSGLCADCRELRDYAIKRLAGCVFAEKKPTCGKCPVHCYKPDMRLRIIEAMRFAGPKMLLRHPYWALRHLLDGFHRSPGEVRTRGKKEGVERR